MSKKTPVDIRINENLKAIDDELHGAVEALSGVNQRINELLESWDGGIPLPMMEQTDRPVDRPDTAVLTDAVDVDSDDEFESDSEDEFDDEDDEFDDDDFDDEDDDDDFDDD